MIHSILIDSVILFLMVYALLDIFTHIAERLSKRLLREKTSEVCPIIFLNRSIYNTEAVIRRAVRECGSVREILLVDLGISDSEFEVARRLCEEYAALVLLNKEQFASFVNSKAQSDV